MISPTSYKLPTRTVRNGRFGTGGQATSYQGGQAVIASVIFLVLLSVVIITGFATPLTRQLKTVRAALNSRQSYFAAESGVEDAAHRLKTGVTVVSPIALSLNGAIIATTITNIGSDKELVATGNSNNHIRKIKTYLTIALPSGGISFNYGVQVGNGGFFLENNSEIKGNVYSNGPITGQNNNMIRGDAVSAGGAGLFDGVHATGTVRAHEIKNSTIDKDAYYVIWGSGNIISGMQYPGSPDQPTVALPISDSQVSDWEADAVSGGTLSSPCPYVITANVTIGPKKIDCDLIIDGSPTVTLTGTIWTSGSIDIKNNAILQVSASLPGKSVVIVADKPTNRTTSSKITLQNDTVYNGSGSGSYILFLSQNNSVESGGNEWAISGRNNVTGNLVLYAGHGEIVIENNINFKEVTGYKIHSKNNTVVAYESGLSSPFFTSGPSGSLTIQQWQEVE